MFDRDVFFDTVRNAPFSGSLSQLQVDGMEAILTVWEDYTPDADRRWLAYMLATTFHETSQEMQPIEEYGKGSGMEYGKVDPETGQTYYGRGFVQLTWRDNYAKADAEIGYEGEYSLEWHAENALVPKVAARVMFQGMYQGWFRAEETLPRYFDSKVNDPFGAREIINGDKNKVPSWSNGVSIGNLIKGYHNEFLKALNASYTAAVPEPEPEPVPEEVTLITIILKVTGTVEVVSVKTEPMEG